MMQLDDKLQELVDALKARHPGIGNKVKVAVAGQKLMSEMLDALQETTPEDEAEIAKQNKKVEKITGKADLYEKLTKVTDLTDKVIQGIEDLKPEELEHEEDANPAHAGGVITRAIIKKEEAKNNNDAKSEKGQDLSAHEERGY